MYVYIKLYMFLFLLPFYGKRVRSTTIYSFFLYPLQGLASSVYCYDTEDQSLKLNHTHELLSESSV